MHKVSDPQCRSWLEHILSSSW